MMALSQSHVDEVCLIDRGESCCRYLAVRPGEEMRCLKLLAEWKTLMDRRVALGQMHSKGDNCEGRTD